MTGGSENLPEQPYPGIQVGGAGIAVNHGHRRAGGRSNHIDFRIHGGEGLIEHRHGEDGGAGGDIAGMGGDAVGGHHTGARISFRRAEGHTGKQPACGIQQQGSRRSQRTRSLAGGEHPGQYLFQCPAIAGPGGEIIEFGDHLRVIISCGVVNGEHPRRLAHAHHLFPGEPPVDVTGQGGEDGQPLYMLLPVQHGLIEMGDTPPLRDVEPEQLGQLRRRLFGHGVSPGAEGGQLVPLLVEGQVTMHHGGDAQRADPGQGDAVFLSHLSGQLREAGLESGPHVVQMIGPHPVLTAVFPAETAGSQRRPALVDEHRFDPGRTQFDPQSRPALFQHPDTLLPVHMICIVHREVLLLYQFISIMGSLLAKLYGQLCLNHIPLPERIQGEE